MSVIAAERTARWQAVEQVREALEGAWRAIGRRTGDDALHDVKEARAALSLLEQLAEAAEWGLAHMPGHSHWREGGAGGVCEACERQREVDDRLAAALAAVRSGRASACCDLYPDCLHVVQAGDA